MPQGSAGALRQICLRWGHEKSSTGINEIQGHPVPRIPPAPEQERPRTGRRYTAAVPFAPARSVVYLIGAGPGAPGLITVRGLECLAGADVVLYDHLVHK